MCIYIHTHTQEYTQLPFALLLHFSIFITKKLLIKRAELGQTHLPMESKKKNYYRKRFLYFSHWMVGVTSTATWETHADHHSWQSQLSVLPESVWCKGLSEDKGDPFSQSHMRSHLITGSISHTSITSLWNSQVKRDPFINC